jgi:hypothetical protein
LGCFVVVVLNILKDINVLFYLSGGGLNLFYGV